MKKAFLALGSNKGERLNYLNKAVKSLSYLKVSDYFKVSSVYETLPFGVKEQANFLNLVLSFQTNLNPYELLEEVKKIEVEIGRQKSFRWGPREIDIDILLLGEEIVESEQLNIPHAYLTERDFFLIPLLELEEDLVHPLTGKKLLDYLDSIESKNILHKFVFEKNNFSGEKIVRH